MKAHRGTPHVRFALQDFLRANLFAKLEKCNCTKSRVELLGFLVGHGTLDMDPAKLSSPSCITPNRSSNPSADSTIFCQASPFFLEAEAHKAQAQAQAQTQIQTRAPSPVRAFPLLSEPPARARSPTNGWNAGANANVAAAGLIIAPVPTASATPSCETSKYED
ncbi:retrotransposon-like protein 1 [Tilletia horrida]|nr:retrotransposon-like protein 1 [Tilletia horrida]